MHHLFTQFFKLKNIYKSIIISSILSICSLEILSIFSLKLGIVPDIYYEKGIKESKHLLNQGVSWLTEENSWGAWHKRNATSRHIKSCFDVTYQSNNIGARDKEDYGYDFPKNSIITLGDSFIEGYGLNHSETLPFNLQELSERKVFNLGSSGNLGPIQYYLIYKAFKEKLPHNTVILGFLPANDFLDNDSQRISLMGQKRYRPYYDISAKDKFYPIIYPEMSEKRKTWGEEKGIISNSYLMKLNTFRLYKNLKIILRHKVSMKIKRSPYAESSHISIDQQNAATFYIKKTYSLAKKNGIKKFIVLGIPNFSKYLFEP